MHFKTTLLASLCVFAACSAQTPSPAQAETGVSAVTVAEGLEHPWGLASLPDGRMLVTERPGRLRIVGADGALSEPLSGVPEVRAAGQGGLLDVALDPAFATNRLVYLSYAEAGDGGAGGTAVARGTLDGATLKDVKVIFRMTPKVQGNGHFGARLAFAPDGMLFITLGERQKFEPSQDLASHLGKVIRIRPDGTVPQDNPFVGRQGVLPEIWSYGHRNTQAAAIHPETGALWIVEMGPAGGDELNIAQAGKNYGWPLVSWGNHYDGRDIPDPPTRPEFEGSLKQWTPVIAPSGMIFYSGAAFPAWKGDALIGGLRSEALVRVDLDGSKIVGEERVSLDRRIRDVEQAADGRLYVITDEKDGALLRLDPK